MASEELGIGIGTQGQDVIAPATPTRITFPKILLKNGPGLSDTQDNRNRVIFELCSR